MILKVANLMGEGLVIATRGEGEKGEKVNLKICQDGELNPNI